MSSGVSVADECVRTFQDLKLGKKFKYIIFGLNKAMSEIVVLKASTESEYDKFVDDLPEDDCRWAVYDFEFQTEGKRNKLCFISWSPDAAKIKSKMVFASSRDVLRRSLVGIAVEIQGTDSTEVSYDTVLAKVKSTTR